MSSLTYRSIPALASLTLWACLFIAIPSHAFGATRQLEERELAGVRGGTMGACVNTGPCGRAASLDYGCAHTTVPVSPPGTYPPPPTPGDFCTAVGATCALADTPGPNEIVCDNTVAGPGCTGGTAVPCVTRVTSTCAQTVWWPSGVCGCVAGAPVGVGTRDTCTANPPAGGGGGGGGGDNP